MSLVIAAPAPIALALVVLPTALAALSTAIAPLSFATPSLVASLVAFATSSLVASLVAFATSSLVASVAIGEDLYYQLEGGGGMGALEGGANAVFVGVPCVRAEGPRAHVIYGVARRCAAEDVAKPVAISPVSR